VSLICEPNLSNLSVLTVSLPSSARPRVYQSSRYDAPPAAPRGELAQPAVRPTDQPYYFRPSVDRSAPDVAPLERHRFPGTLSVGRRHSAMFAARSPHPGRARLRAGRGAAEPRAGSAGAARATRANVQGLSAPEREGPLGRRAPPPLHPLGPGGAAHAQDSGGAADGPPLPRRADGALARAEACALLCAA